jgi:hypothetical protein
MACSDRAAKQRAIRSSLFAPVLCSLARVVSRRACVDLHEDKAAVEVVRGHTPKREMNLTDQIRLRNREPETASRDRVVHSNAEIVASP